MFVSAASCLLHIAHTQEVNPGWKPPLDGEMNLTE